jgi:hypothetical protein
MIAFALLAQAAPAQAAAPAPTCVVRTASNEEVVVADVPRDRYVVQAAPIGSDRRLVTVFATRRGEKLPVAVGFCAGPVSEVPAPAVSAAAAAARLRPEARPDSCAVTDTAGRAALAEYAPFDGGEARFASAGRWPWATKLHAARGESGVSKAGVRVTKLGGRKGIAATEYFYMSGPDAANLVLFDSLGLPGGANTQAAMICSYSNISRGPAPR